MNILAPANFSKCRTYRYTFARDLDPLGMTSGIAVFCGVNPSIANEHRPDPTCTREMNFTRALGYRWYVKVNAFAFVSTDPKPMLAHPEPVGPENDAWILAAARQADILIAAWGVLGAHRGRHEQLLEMLPRPLHCLGVTKAGLPRHPLYLRGDARPQLLGA
jgi:hypothetical protein